MRCTYTQKPAIGTRTKKKYNEKFSFIGRYHCLDGSKQILFTKLSTRLRNRKKVLILFRFNSTGKSFGLNMFLIISS